MHVRRVTGRRVRKRQKKILTQPLNTGGLYEGELTGNVKKKEKEEKQSYWSQRPTQTREKIGRRRRRRRRIPKRKRKKKRKKKNDGK